MFENVEKYLAMIDYTKTIAIIPARGGSKGVPGKNIKSLNGYPLLAYSIQASKMSKEIDRVIVSTDADEIADLAVKYGAEAPFLRPCNIAGDKSTDFEFVEHFIKFAADNEGVIPEYIVHLRPTTPLRDISVIDDAIRIFKEDNVASSLRSAHLASESPYKWFLLNEEGFYRPLSDDVTNETANNGRQQFPDAYIPDGYVDVLKSSYIITNNKLHGVNLRAYVSPFCTEVDTVEDFEYLEYEIRKRGSALSDALMKEYK